MWRCANSLIIKAGPIASTVNCWIQVSAVTARSDRPSRSVLAGAKVSASTSNDLFDLDTTVGVQCVVRCITVRDGTSPWRRARRVPQPVRSPDGRARRGDRALCLNYFALKKSL